MVGLGRVSDPSPRRLHGHGSSEHGRHRGEQAGGPGAIGPGAIGPGAIPGITRGPGRGDSGHELDLLHECAPRHRRRGGRERAVALEQLAQGVARCNRA